MSDEDRRLMTEAELADQFRKATARRPTPPSSKPLQNTGATGGLSAGASPSEVAPIQQSPGSETASKNEPCRTFRCEFCRDGTCIGACRD